MTLKSLVWGKPHALFFQAFANPARISILSLLHEGEKSVTELSTELGFEQTMVSHHLRCLSFCGFVTFERDGKNRIYSLNKPTVLPLMRIAERHMEKFAPNLYDCEVLER